MGMVIGLVLLVVKRSKALGWRKNGCKMAPDV